MPSLQFATLPDDRAAAALVALEEQFGIEVVVVSMPRAGGACPHIEAHRR